MKDRIIKHFILLTSLLLASLFSNGQTTPYFQNFNLSKYNAANQNWDVSIADNGKVYVANGKGLVEYDGLNWKFFELPDKTTIRSVFAHENRVYTGSFEEFGYWGSNKKGELFYTSLKDLITEGVSTDEEFWQIKSLGDNIIFRSFLNLYIFNGETIIKLKPPSTIMSISIVENKLLVSTLKGGIFELKEDKLLPFISNSLLNDKRIVSIEKMEDSFLIATSLYGLFQYSNNTLKVFDCPITSLIKEHQLNEFKRLANGNMAFGTIKNGFYFTDSKGQLLFHVSKNEGLINNTVLGVAVSNGNIWLGLDNGISKVDLKGHYTFFNDVTGKLGAVYDVVKFDGKFYIGSNTGLFYLDVKGQLHFVEGSNGQVWSLNVIDGQLICGHNNGTYLIRDENLELISPYTGGWTIKKIPEKSDTYLQGTYAGLVKFEKILNIWNVEHLGTTTMPIKHLVFENQNIAWGAHAYKGLYKFEFNHETDSITKITNYETKGLWSPYNVRVYKLKNDICFKTNSGWQKYEPLLDSIVPYDLLNKSLGKEAYIISDFDGDILVTKNQNESINFISLSDNTNNLSLTNKYFENRLVVGSEKVSKVNDSIYSLNLNNGFMLINTKNYFEEHLLFPPNLETVRVDNELVHLNEIEKGEAYDLKYGQALTLGVSSSKSENYSLEYAFLNSNSPKWYALTGDNLELGVLSSGYQEIAIRAKNDFGNNSENLIIKINVLPPWYRDTLGFLIYVVTFLIFVLVMYLLHKRRIDKEQQMLQVKFEKEQEEALRKKTVENDKKIIQLRNESLRNEVKLKSKQLANSAMALVKKNEALQDLKQELMSHKDEFNNYYSYKRLIKKINGSIEHDDEWEVFENNFNQVHDEFFTNLKEKHPELTHKDLKICAYIKMNLSTKEIAPLMNISVRGVETHRYRLKKKLDLENDNSLSNYLLNFN